MKPEDARAEYIKCAYNVANNLRNLEIITEYQKKERKRKYMEQLFREPLDEVQTGAKNFPMWNEWMEQQAKRLMRQKFFVITGQTRAGKSEFVKAKFGDKLYVCTCMGTNSPDLRRMEGLPDQEAILFDEASPQLVSANRDLFQAPRHDVHLGQSDTNIYCRHVNVWRMKLIVTCNKWDEMLATLPEADQQWLNGNSFVLRVDSHMFEDASLPSEGVRTL